MSLLPTCVVCDALLRGYGNDCLCERCKQPCPTCGGDVAHCQHPLRQTAAQIEAGNEIIRQRTAKMIARRAA